MQALVVLWLVSKNSKHYTRVCVTLFPGIQLDTIFNDKDMFFTAGSSSRETVGMFCTQVRLYYDPYQRGRETFLYRRF
jgi:hypothetical protein